MGKIKHLFLLCMLFTLSVITTKAQTAVDYQTSTAPSNGSFAADTHWFTIRLRGTYLSVENADNNSYFYSGNGFNTIDNTIDKGLWCVVGDETKGYKFYNKSVGPTKVLAINYVSTGPKSDALGPDARAKMVDASIENATTEGADNWLTTFNIHKNVTSNVGAFSVSVKGLTNYYLNQRAPYLAFWINPGAKEDLGSSFYFYDESSYDASTIEAAITKAQALITTYTDNTGGIYQPTAGELSDFSSKIPTTTNNFTWGNLASINNTIADFKAAIDKHTPTVGKRYLIKNSHNNKYIVPNIIPGSALNVQTGDITKDAVWTLEAGETEGTYKLKNAWSDLYINGVKANKTGTDLKVVTANVYNNTVAIGTGTYEESQQTWLHANADPFVILWTASAGASRWTLTEVSDADFNNYAALPNSYISTLVNKNFLGVDGVATEKEALQNNPTYENYLAYCKKVKAGTDNQYVRLQCAKSGNNRFMGLNDAHTEVNALEASTQKTNLSNIWKLVPVDGDEVCYRLMNANTGTYITNITKAGENKPNPTLTDESNGYKFTFTLKNETNGNWNVIDQNNNKLNAETPSGQINYWTDNGNAGWWIFKATDIEVALHELGDASYASLYLPYSISAVSSAEAYVANNAAVNNTLVMQTTSDGGFDANQGVVLVSDTKASTATLTLGENTNKSLLRGTSRPITLTDETRANYLVFGPKDGAENTVGFWTPATSLTSIAANRAYYRNEGGQHAVRLVFNGSVIEGIDHVVDVNDNVNAPIYDLMGRRVNNTMKHGVYIQNGKKMIVK